MGEGEGGAWFGGVGDVVGVAEAGAPVAEVGAYDERVARVGEVWG